MSNIQWQVDIPEMEELKELLKKHDDLLNEMQQNLNEIYKMQIDVTAKLNQPSVGAND